ncbi:hypothetical protein [Pontimicrobium sp. MEBiC01747]
MKNYITTALILVTGLAVSQNKPTDKITTTQTKIVKAKDGNTTYDKKVKVITTKEQEVKLDPKDKGKIDGDRVFPPTKVTKTILVDNDKDPFYDELTKVKYYKHNGNKYAFEKTSEGFVMNYFKNNKKLKSGKAIKSSSNPYYLVVNGDKQGVGYFDNNNKFIIEYISIDEDKIERSEFENSDF